MKKKLAIRGHSTRGKEVIELLEMMGGINIRNLDGEANAYSYYLVDNIILHDRLSIAEDDDFEIFTLQGFLEKYPYKVGDKVYIKVDPNENCLGYDKIYSAIESATWIEKGGYLVYKLKDYSRIFYSDELHLYKEESMEDNKLSGTICDTAETKSYTVSLKDGKVIDNSIDASQFMQIGKTVAVCFNTENYEDEVELQLGDYEIVVRDDKTYAVKKKPKCPTNYDDCCKVLGISYRAQLSYTYPDVERGNIYLTKEKHLLDAFMKLRICRNAYWKIAGEQMGLGKPWEPDWDNLSTNHEFIKINKGCFTYSSRVLVFPTEEIRDAFYENFKDLIEQCKKLL